MKPPPFGYVAPTTLEEAVDALAEPGAVVLAGGQSLVLELVYRQHRPQLLIDINEVPGLDALEDLAPLHDPAPLDGSGSGGLTIGALVRHRRLEADEGGSPVRRLLTRIAPWVAHPPIRARGTFCGSVAWAHPAAEWNAVALAFDAHVLLRSSHGSREVEAADWYRGDHTTARLHDELVTGVRLAPVTAATGVGFAEHRRTHASFADVAVVAAVTPDGAHPDDAGPDGTVQQLRLAVVGVTDRPLRLSRTEAVLAGTRLDALATAVRECLTGSDEVPGDPHHRAVAAELAGRAVAEAVADMRGELGAETGLAAQQHLGHDTGAGR